MSPARADARALRDALFTTRRRRPEWFSGVVATAVGPKIADGRMSDEEAIQFIVPRKRAEKRLALSERIPKSLDGIATDVVRLGGELDGPELTLAAPEAEVGLGTPIVSDDNTSTLAAAGSHSDRSVVIGCAHGVARNRPVNDESGRLIGRCVQRVETLFGHQLGPDWNQPERFLIDLSVISLEPGIAPSSGLPGGAHFRAPSPLRVAARLPGAGAWALAGRRNVWLQGVVTSLWPRPSNPAMRFTGLCLVQHAPMAVAGDSGTMWLARLDGQPTAIGTHYGVDWSSSNAPRLAFVALSLEVINQSGVTIAG